MRSPYRTAARISFGTRRAYVCYNLLAQQRHAAAASFNTKSICPYQAMSIQKVSIRQVKAARALLGWSQKDLAAAALVSEPTIKRLEADEGWLGGRAETAKRILSAFQREGVVFIHGNGRGVRLRK